MHLILRVEKCDELRWKWLKEKLESVRHPLAQHFFLENERPTFSFSSLLNFIQKRFGNILAMQVLSGFGLGLGLNQKRKF